MALFGHYRFSKALRLRNRHEFVAVQRQGRRWQCRHITVVGRRRREGPARIGLVVSRRVGNAVSRNKVKRLIREAFRVSRRDLPEAVDLVVVARPTAPGASFRQLRGELLEAARELERRLPALPRGDAS